MKFINIKECAICLEKMYTDREKTTCNHVFHTKCMQKYHKKCVERRVDTSCPVCRNILHEIRLCYVCNGPYADYSIIGCQHYVHYNCWKMKRTSCLESDHNIIYERICPFIHISYD